MKIDFDINQNELLILIKTLDRVDMSSFNEEECELFYFFIDELKDALNYGLYTN